MLPAVAVLFPAAGRSSRFGGREKKPFATIDGRALARTGNVIMDTNVVELPQCILPFAYWPQTIGIISAGVITYEILKNDKKSKSPN